jgi:hypothetical protein
MPIASLICMYFLQMGILMMISMQVDAHAIAALHDAPDPIPVDAAQVISRSLH